MKREFDSTRKLYTLCILVEDVPGVLSQVARLFSRKGYNIESIVSGATDRPGITRISIEILADELMIEQIAAQCRKLLPVKAVKILDEDTIEFDTAWSNPDPIMEKLGEMYPGIHVEHWWADEDVGSNTGHRVMFDGGVVEERFDGDSDAYSIYTMLWGESKCVYLDENGLIQHRDCDVCDGCG